MAQLLQMHKMKGISLHVHKQVVSCDVQPRHVSRVSNPRNKNVRRHLSTRHDGYDTITRASANVTAGEPSQETEDVAEQSILEEAPSFENLGVDEMFVVSFGLQELDGLGRYPAVAPWIANGSGIPLGSPLPVEGPWQTLVLFFTPFHIRTLQLKYMLMTSSYVIPQTTDHGQPDTHRDSILVTPAACEEPAVEGTCIRAYVNTWPVLYPWTLDSYSDTSCLPSSLTSSIVGCSLDWRARKS
jgi:hypothetical protein